MDTLVDQSLGDDPPPAEHRDEDARDHAPDGEVAVDAQHVGCDRGEDRISDPCGDRRQQDTPRRGERFLRSRPSPGGAVVSRSEPTCQEFGAA